MVNGTLAQIGDSGTLKDKILIDDQPLKKPEKTYLAVYKPKGFVSSLDDPYEKTLSELLPEDIRVYPAGRLDKDADGLLICTNDGTLANKIMHPRYTIEKSYIIITYERIPKEVISIINQYGVEIKDGYIPDIKIVKITSNVHKITVHVGYHKVVKKIFDKFGIRVKQLTRVSIGPVSLGKLRGWRNLTAKELTQLQKIKPLPKREGNLKGFKDAFRRYASLQKTPLKTQQERKKVLQRFERKNLDIEQSNSYREEESRGRFGKRFDETEKKPFEKRRKQKFR